MIGGKRYYHVDTPDDAGGGAPQMIDPAQESLSQALRAGFNVLRVIMIILLVAYFASGWFQVNHGEQGVIVRLGELRINDDEESEYGGTSVFGEGLHFSLPDPLDEKIRLSGKPYRLVIRTFCPPLSPADTAKRIADLDLQKVIDPKTELDPGSDGAMITGDSNLSHGVWAVEYRVIAADKFIANVGDSERDVERMLRRLLENAIVRTVAGMPVERIVRTRTDEVTGDFTKTVQSRLEAALQEFDTGVTVVNVEAVTATPGNVRQAFLKVTDALNDRKKKEDEAEQERNRILSRAAGSEDKYEELLAAIQAYGAAQAAGAGDARLEELRLNIDTKLDSAEGEVAIRLRRAQSQANEIREGLRNEYQEYAAYRESWRKFPELTVLRLWVKMREAVFANIQSEKFFVPDSGEIEIITNRDVERLLEADIQRYKDRYKNN